MLFSQRVALIYSADMKNSVVLGHEKKLSGFYITKIG